MGSTFIRKLDPFFCYKSYLFWQYRIENKTIKKLAFLGVTIILIKIIVIE